MITYFTGNGRRSVKMADLWVGIAIVSDGILVLPTTVRGRATSRSVVDPAQVEWRQGSGASMQKAIPEIIRRGSAKCVIVSEPR